MEEEPPAKVRVGKKPADKGASAPAPEIMAAEYVRSWSGAAEAARRRHRYEDLSLRLRAVALLLDKPALRAPEALAELAPDHPAVRLRRALEAVRAAVELRRQPV